MTIGFIGAGKVGCSLGKYFSQRGIPVSGYYSKSIHSAQEAAHFTGTSCFPSIEELLGNSTMLFCTVPDDIIPTLFDAIPPVKLQDKYIAHCSGALSSQALSLVMPYCRGTGSLHPICAISHRLTGWEALSHAYFTVEGSCSQLLTEIISKCGNPVQVIAAEKKALYHGAAVVASNLVVALYHTAVSLLQQCELDQEFSEKALAPLFLGNAHSILERGCTAALTGPVERGDAATICRHLQALSGREAEIYRLLSLQLIGLAKAKNPQRDYSETLASLQSYLR